MNTLISYKRVTYDFEILETFEAGISLLGTEVKSVRKHQGQLEGAHVVIRGGEAFLTGATIPPYQQANAPKSYEHDRTRKLLLSKKEIERLGNKGEQKGLTIVPIRLYNANRKLKLEIALVRGKKKQDKRELIKKRDTDRDLARELRRS